MNALEVLVLGIFGGNVEILAGSRNDAGFSSNASAVLDG